jgi:glycosyltransferase involved in cell wall biosynthesis
VTLSDLTGVRISCICPTFNRVVARPELLAEAVESFARQTYPNRELLILNDHPGQEIVCTTPGVRVVNHPVRFASLGEKYNAAVEMASGSILVPWEDDDVSLPHRLADSVVILRRFAYFNPRGSWYLTGGKLHKDHLQGVNHNASAFTREAWKAAGGYPHDNKQDAGMDSRLRAQPGAWTGTLKDPRAWSYIYRWGVSDCHLSGSSDTARAWADYGARATTTGRFVVEPRWRADYAAMCRGAV